MAYVITDNCTKDELCIQACPVDCIHPRSDEDGFDTASQVYVDPANCIDCGACIPVCPSDAIFPMDANERVINRLERSGSSAAFLVEDPRHARVVVDSSASGLPKRVPSTPGLRHSSGPRAAAAGGMTR